MWPRFPRGISASPPRPLGSVLLGFPTRGSGHVLVSTTRQRPRRSAGTMLVFTPVRRRMLDFSAGRGRLLAATWPPSARLRSPESPLLRSCSCPWLADQLCRCVGRSGPATQELAPSPLLPMDAASQRRRRTGSRGPSVSRCGPRCSRSDLVRFPVDDPVDRAGAAHVGSCAMPRRESHGPWRLPGVTRLTESPAPPPLDWGVRSHPGGLVRAYGRIHATPISSDSDYIQRTCTVV